MTFHIIMSKSDYVYVYVVKLCNLTVLDVFNNV